MPPLIPAAGANNQGGPGPPVPPGAAQNPNGANANAALPVTQRTVSSYIKNINPDDDSGSKFEMKVLRELVMARRVRIQVKRMGRVQKHEQVEVKCEDLGYPDNYHGLAFIHAYLRDFNKDPFVEMQKLVREVVSTMNSVIPLRSGVSALQRFYLYEQFKGEAHVMSFHEGATRAAVEGSRKRNMSNPYAVGSQDRNMAVLCRRLDALIRNLLETIAATLVDPTILSRMSDKQKKAARKYQVRAEIIQKKFIWIRGKWFDDLWWRDSVFTPLQAQAP